jgi:hypothetical protein
VLAWASIHRGFTNLALASLSRQSEILVELVTWQVVKKATT